MANRNGKRGARETAAENRVKAFNLRKAGATYLQIGQQLGVSEQMAHKYIASRHAELEKLEEAEAKDLHRINQERRRLEEERLDALILGLWPAASKGDPQSASAALRVLESRRKLLGLDAPTKIAETDAAGNDLDLATLATRARENRARREAEKAAAADTADA